MVDPDVAPAGEVVVDVWGCNNASRSQSDPLLFMLGSSPSALSMLYPSAYPPPHPAPSKRRNFSWHRYCRVEQLGVALGDKTGGETEQ